MRKESTWPLIKSMNIEASRSNFFMQSDSNVINWSNKHTTFSLDTEIPKSLICQQFDALLIIFLFTCEASLI